ncbi:MAG: sulfite exporter TauE/SafE family protein [Gemmatimonadota bacterium]
MSGLEYLLVGLAAAVAGAVNALAGGGTLISFPALLAVGVPPVAANVTNTVSLTPGYLGATAAQLRDLRGQRRRMWLLLPVSAVGGLAGALLLLHTGESTFRALVPWLILGASGLLAVQEPVKRWAAARVAARAAEVTNRATSSGANPATPSDSHPGAVRDAVADGARRAPGKDLAVASAGGVAAVYGGYFGAGLSVIILAVLGLAIDESLTRLNALKQLMSFAVNITAAVLFAFSGKTVWAAAFVMAVGAVVGGVAGGRLASRVKPRTLRRVVVGIGVVVAVIYFVK